MSLVNKDFVAGALTNFRGILNDQFTEGVRNWPMAGLVTDVPSTGDAEDYSWLGDYPAFREFKGQAIVKDFLVKEFKQENRKYEATLDIKTEVFDDDGAKLNIIRPRINAMADAAIRHRHRLMIEKILENPTVYDGASLFSNTHNEGKSGNNDNLLSGAGTSLANVQTDFRAARAAMRKFTTDQGEHVNGEMDLVVLAPPDLEGVFEELLEATVISNTTNTLRGAARLVTSPYLETLTGGDANDWYLMNVSGEIKALAWQDRMPPQLNGVTDPEDSYVIKNDAFLWQVKYRGAVAPLLWQKIVKVVNS